MNLETVFVYGSLKEGPVCQHGVEPEVFTIT
jgi:gamma-glutamylcyclotransferase (GGCT)/AIG2-like uncharacterized protein YtfP